MFTILCLLCLCGNREYPSSFQSKAASIKIFLRAQVKWKGRYIWSGRKHSRFIIYLLHMGVILTIIKAFIILFLLCQWEQGTPGSFQNKSVNSPFIWVSGYILFLPKLKGKERPFLEERKKRDPIVRLSPRALRCHKRYIKKVSPFLKFEIMLPLLCLSDPLTNKHYRTWSSMINLRIDSRTYQK